MTTQAALAKLKKGNLVLQLGGGGSSSNTSGVSITPLASMASLQSLTPDENTFYDLPADTTLTSDEQALDSNNNS